MFVKLEEQIYCILLVFMQIYHMQLLAMFKII